jgi:hypothetical protein
VHELSELAVRCVAACLGAAAHIAVGCVQIDGQGLELEQQGVVHSLPTTMLETSGSTVLDAGAREV